jgi:serine/threonine-protein phosphatase 2A regulatory subunit B
MMTGSYSNDIHIYGRDDDYDVTLQADKSAFKAKKLGSTKNKITMSQGNRGATSMGRRLRDENEYMDYNKKILHSSWHPRENTIAVAATNNLFIFT